MFQMKLEKKLSEASKNRPPISDETRRKRSESLKRYWAEKHKNEADELSNK